MNNFMKRPCPVCNGLESSLIYHQNFSSSSIAVMKEYDVICCKKCGFVYADKIPKQEVFDRYYNEMSKYEFSHQGGSVGVRYVNYYKRVAEFINEYNPDPNIEIVDIGCSTGALLNELSKYGYKNLTGIDPSESCTKIVKEKFGIKAITSSLNSLDTKTKYDVVIFSAVLEHLVDFDAAFIAICKLLSPNGVLFIEVPDASRFHKYAFTPYQQFSIEHINYFTISSIRNLLKKYGFNIIKAHESINDINQTVDPNLMLIAEYDENNTSQIEIERDEEGLVQVLKYLEASNSLNLKIEENIKNAFEEHNTLIVWGIGTFTQSMLDKGLVLNKVRYFVDSNSRYHHKLILGKQIKKPEDIIEKDAILISTFSYFDEVKQKIIKSLNLDNPIIDIFGAELRKKSRDAQEQILSSN